MCLSHLWWKQKEFKIHLRFILGVHLQHYQGRSFLLSRKSDHNTFSTTFFYVCVHRTPFCLFLILELLLKLYQVYYLLYSRFKLAVITPNISYCKTYHNVCVIVFFFPLFLYAIFAHCAFFLVCVCINKRRRSKNLYTGKVKISEGGREHCHISSK